MTKTILVIGANRGIGFELSTRFHHHGHTVYGTYRPETRNDTSVSKLVKEGIKTLELDLTNESSISAAALQFGDQTLDILINVGGVYYLWDDKPFYEHSAEDLEGHFKVNVVGPFLTSKHFLPNLMKSASGTIINMSSDFASIEDNIGGNVAYRVSKCGLNQLTRTMAFDLTTSTSCVQTFAIHPGFVPTRMTGFKGVDDMEECMSSLVKVIQKFSDREEAAICNGGYYRWDGKKMDY